MKFDFSDLYRFLVSTGIVLISLALIIPWLALREPIEVIFSDDEYLTLHADSRELVDLKQRLLHRTIMLVPYVSTALFLLGIIIGLLGIWRWATIQDVSDRRQKVALETEERKLRDMTPKESTEKIRLEVFEAFNGEPKVDEAKNFESIYRDIELKVAKRLDSLFVDSHNILTEQKVSDVRIDIVLRGRTDQNILYFDYIVEVKFARQSPSFSSIKSSYLQSREALKKYESSQGRRAKSLLIFVVSDAEWDAEKFDSLQSRVRYELRHRSRMNVIAGFSISEIDSLSEESFAKRLEIL